MNNLTGKDNQFFKLAFWALGLAAAWMWLPIKDTLLNFLSVLVGAVVVFAVADSILIMLGAISSPAHGVQATVVGWLESMKSTPSPATTPVASTPVAPAAPAAKKAPEVVVRRNTSP